MSYVTYGDGMMEVTEIHLEQGEYRRLIAAARDEGYMEGHNAGWHQGFDCAEALGRETSP